MGSRPASKVNMKTYEIHRETRFAQPTVATRATLAVTEMREWFPKAFAATYGQAVSQDATVTGPPYARYHMVGEGRFEVEAGFPVSEPITPVGDVYPGTLPGGTCAVTSHIGPYDGLSGAYRALEDWISAQGGTVSADPWEVYYSDPEEEPETLRTDVYMPFVTN